MTSGGQASGVMASRLLHTALITPPSSLLPPPSSLLPPPSSLLPASPALCGAGLIPRRRCFVRVLGSANEFPLTSTRRCERWLQPRPLSMAADGPMAPLRCPHPLPLRPPLQLPPLRPLRPLPAAASVSRVTSSTGCSPPPSSCDSRGSCTTSDISNREPKNCSNRLALRRRHQKPHSPPPLLRPLRPP